MIECKTIYNVYPTEIVYTTNFYVSSDELVATRIVSGKLYKLSIKLNGLDDLVAKHYKVSRFNDELFITFASIDLDDW